MVFKAILFHIHDVIILKLLESDLNDITNNREYYLGDNYKIVRYGSFELDSRSLYLPGSSDYDQKLPRSLSLKFHTIESKNRWVNNYIREYKKINGVDAEVINLDTPVFETEDSPEVKLA